MGDSKAIANRDSGLHWFDQLLSIQWNDRPRLLLTLFCVLGIILVAPVWTVKYPPLVDFPNHLASSFVLAHMHDPKFHFSKFYAPNWQLSPYVTMDLLLVALQKFLPVQIAGRAVLTLSLLAVPLAVWVFVREANPGESKLAFWSLLLCNNMYFFLYGLINMQLSMALCFLTLGLWLRYLRSPGRTLWWLVCGSATFLYFTHIVGFGVACIVVTCYLLITRRPVREMIFSWLLFLPGMGFYLYWKASDTTKWPMVFPSLIIKLERVSAVIVGYSSSLDFLTLLVILICILWGAADNPEFKVNVSWLVVTACLFAVYLVLPSEYGPGGMVARRILPFIFVVGLAAAKLGRRGRYLVPIALVLFIARTANVEQHFVKIQPRLDAFARSFEVIPRGSRVFPIVQRTVEKGTPEDTFWAYGVIDRGWFSPYLFHNKGVQPLRIKLNTYSLGRYAAFVTRRKPIQWATIRAEYDYIWAFGTSDYSQQMSQIGKVVFKSHGLEVYRLTKPAA